MCAVSGVPVNPAHEFKICPAMAYSCVACGAALARDHLLGQTTGTIPNARVCDQTCAQRWESAQRQRTEWTWLPVSAWVQSFRDGVTEHSIYEQPSDEQIVWRYLDFPKFVDLILRRELYLSAADKLGDPFEGSLSLPTIEKFQQIAKEKAEEWGRELGAARVPVMESDLLNAFRGDYISERQWTYVSCWHMNSFESAAMWAAYGRDGPAVAIRSTFGRLRDCVEAHQAPPHGEPLLAKVKYLDYSRDVVPAGFHLSPFLYKRKSFEHESELRVMMQLLPHIGEPSAAGQLLDIGRPSFAGVRIEVDLQALIEKILVAPDAPSWFVDLVKDVTRKFDVNVQVEQSSLLLGSPVF